MARSMGALLLLGLLGGCDAENSLDPKAIRATVTPAPAREQNQARFDVRRVIADRKRLEGTEQVCNLVHVGRLAEAETRIVHRYPFPISRRRLIRCDGPNGGWADLVFRKEARQLAPYVETGQQLRVKVIAAGGGFENYPILEFVATMGDAAPAETEEGEPNIGDDFAIADGGADANRTRTCSVAFVGRFEKIHHRRMGYPQQARYRMSVACRHSRGLSWVDAVFSAREVDDALSLRRWERRPWTIYRASGGLGDEPIVVPALPMRR